GGPRSDSHCSSLRDDRALLDNERATQQAKGRRIELGTEEGRLGCIGQSAGRRTGQERGEDDRDTSKGGCNPCEPGGGAMHALSPCVTTTDGMKSPEQ